MREPVLDLLTRLEALVRQAAAVPRTEKKIVDERAVLGVVQMIRSALPEDLREAQRLRAEAERTMRSAQDEARRLVLEAQGTARRLLEEHAIAKEAVRRREDFLAQAERDARGIRAGADAYAASVLSDLEQSVARVLEAIRRGRELLKDVPASAYNEQSGSDR
ncbi:MAG TPA: hypothetical protein VFW08_10125 [bacterium]|nr:hypothetical protein [bacterium]